jgi:V/A-type H+-transporting ATPase subunit F
LNSIVVVGDEDTVTGFRLAGVKDSLIHESADETERFVRSTLQRDVGVVVITERVASEIRELMERLRGEKGRVRPIFVEIPDKRGPMESEDRLQKLVRRVVGTEVTFEAT